MKIVVLNGSPKGKNSVTLHTELYIERLFPDCEFEIVHVGQRIKALERDMSATLEAISAADMILFCYPVYTFIAPYQLHRFIELLKATGIDFYGKCATQISTSKHFYDVTAHRYIDENCFDMGMKVIHGLSADMDDLLTEKGRTEAEAFWRYALFCAENEVFDSTPISKNTTLPTYTRQMADVEKKSGFDTVIVTNREPDDERLGAMIEDLSAVYPYPTRVVNIAEYPFMGGCLGCFKCATTGKCVYKDGFDDFLRNEIQRADAIVYAFTIRDHSMGASMKIFDDRQFCNGHRTVTMGSPVGYIVNGDYGNEPNLHTIIEGRSQVGGNYLAGVATDAESISALSARLGYALEHKLTLPQNFYGVGGMKIFRDLIYLMRGLMRADHKFYKEHGIYDFPQKKQGTILKIKLLGMLISIPSVQKKMGNKMTEGMIAPYKKAIEKVAKNE